MGFKQTLICPICNYTAFTSGGPDRGFDVYTNTYVCLDCKILTDLIIEKPIDSKPEKIMDGQNCRNCGNLNFEIWESEKKPCPTCASAMKPYPGGMSMNWD